MVKDVLAINCLPSNHYFAHVLEYDARVDNQTRRAVARNVERLRKAQNPPHGWSQQFLAKRAGVAQRTISNIEKLDHLDKRDYSPTLDALQKIAVVFGMEAWHLMLPNLPDELLADRRLDKVVECFTTVNEEGRANIARTAEAEVRYSQRDEKSQAPVKRK